MCVAAYVALIPSCVHEWVSTGLFGSFSAQPVCSGRVSLSHSAGVNGDRVLALLAADWAAPGKLAGAALHHLGPARSVPRPAAHQLAAVRGQPRGSWVCFRRGQRHFSLIVVIYKLDNLFFFPVNRSYRYTSYQRSREYRCQGRDGRSLETEKGTQGLWQQGVWPAGRGGAGLSWILRASGVPEGRRRLLRELTDWEL